MTYKDLVKSEIERETPFNYLAISNLLLLQLFNKQSKIPSNLRNTKKKEE